MKKLAMLLVLVLSAGYISAGAAQPGQAKPQPKPGVQQQSSDPTPAQVFGAFADLLDAANGGHQQGQHPGFPNPGHPQPYPQHPGQPQQPWNNYNDHNQPGNGHNNHNQPWDNGNNHPQYPPYYPPNPQYPGQTQTFRFDSGTFVFASDANRSMEEGAAALQRAGYLVLEKRSNYNTYSLVFQAPSYMRIGKYVSGTYTFASDAQKAAAECAAAMQAQGKLILEKNVSGTQFTVSYLEGGYNNGYNETQTYNSGTFVFASDAAKAMNETAAALQSIGAVIIEKRQNGTSYTIVFQAQFRMETQNYASGTFVFASDAARSMNETAAALQSIRNVIILEKRQNGTTYNIVFLAAFRLQPQKYTSGTYTFASDAQKAAGETAAAFASQGMIILEKNVTGTQFTITYFRPSYY